ncbi:hypothetical protein AJ80_03119 [Polytolypa hystricis UAMH7299]|uniref:Peroxin/Ferlin domain-containing protein n=1 Tax=Polytolypa hystricis (strain UAMH7299) TaxID=1447883 RepID=A0A2B7YKH0_POLH7|nr:hypothetical protein AJ80_03119 [Polytolypa hystricis UAMH7299]
MAANSVISLVDNTQPPASGADVESLLRTGSSKQRLVKKLTKGSVREGLTRRKYAKWQKDRYDPALPADVPGRPTSTSRQSDGDSASRQLSRPTSADTSPSDEGEVSVIEVLYENQRGWWFFGAPYFSAQSLLNLDPPGWVTKDMEQSPVNITNAQLPDPSWEWTWKTWYVDMGYDVDEEGWQYSFSFASRFAWHGTHPWVHSFVRRRRWLRKRVKKTQQRRGRGTGAFEIAHLFNEDYFTIHSHPVLEESVGFGGAGGVARPSVGSRSSYQDDRDEILPDDITNVSALTKVLKIAPVDREKIDAVKYFVRNAHEELYYLPGKIPDIMSMFMFQVSRKQLLDHFVRVAHDIPLGPDASVDVEMQKRNDLLKTIDTINSYFKEQGFWGDVVDEKRRSSSATSLASEPTDRKGKGKERAVEEQPQTIERDFGNGESFVTRIKGIPEEARVGNRRRNTSQCPVPVVHYSQSASAIPSERHDQDQIVSDRARVPGLSPSSQHGIEQPGAVPVRRVEGIIKRSPEYGILKAKKAQSRLDWNIYLDIINTLAALSKKSDKDFSPSGGYKVIYLPEEALIELVGDEQENMWIIPVATGCRVHVLNKGEGTVGLLRKVHLIGSPQAISFAEKQIYDVTRKARLNRLNSLTAESLKIRPVWTNTSPFQQQERVTGTRHDHIPRPRQFTIRSFAEYVELLTRARIERGVRRQIYSSSERHVPTTVKTLFDLFNDPANRRYFSTRAINLLTSYYQRKRSIHLLRALFSNFEDLMTTRSCNAMLQSTAQAGRWLTFKHILNVMAEFNIKPGGMPWVNFILGVPSNEARYLALREMGRIGLLNHPHIVGQVATAIVSQTFPAHVESGMPVNSYINKLCVRFGNEFMSTSIANLMLRIVAQRNNMEGFEAIVSHCKQAGLVLTTSSLNSGLKIFWERNQLHDAVKFYFQFVSHFHARRTETTTRILFALAVKNHAYNVVRVMWRYACLEGRVSFAMQSTMFTSLLSNKPPHYATHDPEWPCQMGKIAAGIGIEHLRLDPSFDILKQDAIPEIEHDNPCISYLYGFRPQGPARIKQRELAGRVLEHDLEAVKTYAPVVPFGQMLAAASELDKTWQSSSPPMEFSQMLTEAIRIPVVRTWTDADGDHQAWVAEFSRKTDGTMLRRYQVAIKDFPVDVVDLGFFDRLHEIPTGDDRKSSILSRRYLFRYRKDRNATVDRVDFHFAHSITLSPELYEFDNNGREDDRISI